MGIALSQLGIEWDLFSLIKKSVKLTQQGGGPAHQAGSEGTFLVCGQQFSLQGAPRVPGRDKHPVRGTNEEAGTPPAQREASQTCTTAPITPR